MSDLDSFFAKKDKKKLKGKKFTTTDEIARRLEETEKKLEHQQGIKVKTEPVKKVEENSEETPATEEPSQKVRVGPCLGHLGGNWAAVTRGGTCGWVIC